MMRLFFYCSTYSKKVRTWYFDAACCMSQTRQKYAVYTWECLANSCPFDAQLRYKMPQQQWLGLMGGGKLLKELL